MLIGARGLVFFPHSRKYCDYVCRDAPSPVQIITGRNEVVAKVMFLHVCVCPQGWRVSASVHAGMTDPPGPGRPPPDQADPPGPGRHPPRPGRAPPGPGRPPRPGRTPPDQAEPPRPGRHPPDQGDTPRTRLTPPREADPSIRSTSCRYASYWNAFLFSYYFLN